MAMDTEEILLLAIPHSGPLAVESCLPFPEYGTVALPAEIIRLAKFDEPAVCQSERVTIIRIMTIKTPTARHMLQSISDILMHVKLSRRPVNRHALMAL